MKKNTHSLLLLLFIFVISGSVIFSQTKSSAVDAEKTAALYDVMNMKFVLEGTPSPAAVGFNDAKSIWQFSYKLEFLNDWKQLNELGEKTSAGNQNETRQQRETRIQKNSKLHDKLWKKSGTLVIRGKTPKKQISSAENRELIIPAALTQEIKNTLAKAGATLDNPIFRVSLRGKVLTKTSAGLKFNQKISQSFLCPTKLLGKDTQYWMMNTCGISIELTGNENGIKLGLISRL